MINYFLKFLHSEQAGGFLLLLCTIIALLLANSEIADSYFKLWEMEVGFIGNDYVFMKSLRHWVDDGLMVIFFLMVGLEIKREFISGELSSTQKAILPGLAAIGGMVVPAAIFLYFNFGTNTVHGWGIPMATDIAFSLAVLSLVKNVPVSVRIFLVALAVADDIGAIMVIAVFYSDTIQLLYLAGAVLVIFILLFMNKRQVLKLSWYIFFGLILWFLVLKSGVHATIAGVILAFTIPFNEDKSNSPLHTLESALHTPVNFIILPLFALANTGIIIEASSFLTGLQSADSLGIILGLTVGKPVGIFGAVIIAILFKWAKLPDGTKLAQFLGVGFLCGIGYTMSIFISGLAYTDTALIDSSKISVLVASLLAAVIGLTILTLTSRGKQSFNNEDDIAKYSETDSPS